MAFLMNDRVTPDPCAAPTSGAVTRHRVTANPSSLLRDSQETQQRPEARAEVAGL